jgi:uncharacterized protein with beta-barrel porin domain
VQNLLVNLLEAQAQNAQQNALDQLHPGVFKAVSITKEALMDNLMLGMVKECELEAITENNCLCSRPTSQVSAQEDDWGSYLFSDHPPQIPSCSPRKKGQLFFKGMGSLYFQQTQGQYVGFKNASGGFLFGGGVNLLDHMMVNLALCYQTGGVNFYKHRGSASINQYAASILAHYSSKKYEAALGYSASYNTQSDKRKVEFQSIYAVAKNTHASWMQSGFLKGGLFYNLSPTLTVGPYDYLSGVYQQEDSFNESGAGILDLATKQAHSLYFRNELGVKFNTCVAQEQTDIKAFFKAAYVQQVHVDSQNYTTQIEALPPSFTVSGWAPTRALGLMGVGLNVGYGHNQWDFGFEYDIEACHGYVGQRGELGFSLHF